MSILRNVLLSFAVVCGLQQAVHAQSQDVQEGDFPCALVMCFANPAGAWAIPACHPPLNWLFARFARREGFPTCSFGDGGGATFRAQPNVDCIQGFSPQSTSGDDGGPTFSGICARLVQSCNEPMPTLPSGATGQCVVQGSGDDFDVSYWQKYNAPRGVTQYATTVTNKDGGQQTYFFNVR